jgi:hypothetical protein
MDLLLPMLLFRQTEGMGLFGGMQSGGRFGTDGLLLYMLLNGQGGGGGGMGGLGTNNTKLP